MNWPAVRFEELFDGSSRNGLYKSKEHHGSGTKIVNMGELFGFDRIGDQDMERVQVSALELDRFGLRHGDLLFGRRSLVEEGAGRCALVYHPPEPVTFESSIIRVRLDSERADPNFYFYYFRSHRGRAAIRSIVSGATVKGIRGSDLQNLRIDHPKISVQRRAVEVLSAYDDLIDKNQRRIKLLEEAARRLYREWFVALRFPGREQIEVVNGVPHGWTRRTLGDVCSAIGGATPATGRPDYWDGDITWLTPTDVTRNGCLFLADSARKITKAGLESCSSQLMPPGTIFMTSRASIGYFAILDHAACTNQGFISVLPIARQSREFLLFHLMSRVEEFTSRSTGSTFLELSKKTFRAMECVWPSEYVIAQYSHQAAPMLGQIEVLKKQLDAARQARDTLLPRLMSGALAV